MGWRIACHLIVVIGNTHINKIKTMDKWETNIEPYLKEIEDWAGRGASDREIASNLNVAYSTFRNHAKKHEELRAALKRGKNRAKRVMQKALQEQGRVQKIPPVAKEAPPYAAPPANQMPRPDQQGRHRGPFERNKKRIYRTQEVCGICGRPVDKSLKYPHPMAPCIDHIIPIAKGGHPSDINNLQLAHWTCNRQKSDKVTGTTSAAKVVEVISNRILPQSMDWTKYRSNK